MAEAATSQAPPAAQPAADPNNALLAALAGGNVPANPGDGEAGSSLPPPPGFVIDTKDKGQKAQPPAPATPAPQAQQAPQAQDPDAFAKWLSATTSTEAPKWSDDAKKLFKDTYGEDDPIAYRDTVTKRLAEAELLKKDADTARTIQANLQRIEKENPVLHAAIVEQMEGRDGLEYISKMPSANVLNKEAKDLSDEVLINTYLKERFTDEERRAKRTGDYMDTDFDKEQLDAKYKMFRPVAEHMHEQRLAELRGRIESREKEMASMREREAKSLADALATAQNDPIARIHMNQESIDALRNGSIFQGVFLNPDGTLHPNALASLVRAKHYDGDVRRALAIGEQRGYQRGLQEGMAQMPGLNGGRSIANNNPQQGDPHQSVIASMIR